MTRKQLKTLMNTIDGNIKASHAYRDIMTWIDEQENENTAMLERENKAFAEAFKKLGYTDAEISDIANGAI